MIPREIIDWPLGRPFKVREASEVMPMAQGYIVTDVEYDRCLWTGGNLTLLEARAILIQDRNQ